MSQVGCPVCGTEASLYLKKTVAGRTFDIYKCIACGLGFVHPLPSKEELEAVYLKGYYESEYEWGYHTPYGELENPLKRMYRRILRRAFKNNKFPSSVLDVGCAYGFLLDVARELGATRTVGLDVSEEAERIVLSKGHHFVRGFFEDAKLNESFDLVYMGDVLEHFREPHRVMEKLRLVTHSGSAVIVTTVNFDSFMARFFKDRWRLLSPPEHLFFWTKRSLWLLFRYYGFSGYICKYWLTYPKEYVIERFKRQFGFYPFFIHPLPVKHLSVPGLDVIMGIFKRS